MSGHQGCRGVRGVLGADRNCRYSGARRGIGTSGVLGAPRECRGPFFGCQGDSGCRGVLGWQMDWEPDHIGPQSRVPAVPLVPLGE